MYNIQLISNMWSYFDKKSSVPTASKSKCAVYILNIVCLLVYSDASDIVADVQTIRIHGLSANSSYLVEFNKPLNIEFDADIRRCTYGPKATHVDSGQIPIVTREMSALWTCYLQNNNRFYFEIKVKAAYLVNVTVAGEEVTFMIESGLGTNYDCIHKYAVYVGDTIDITCGNLYEKGHIKLQYYDSRGKEVFKTQSMKKESDLVFRTTVKEKNFNQSYVDCVYVTPINDLEQTFKYRTMMNIPADRITHDGGFIVTINDMKLTKMSVSSYDKHRYIYKFLNMQPIKLTCSKINDQLKGPIYLHINNVKHNISTHTTDMEATATFITSANLENLVIECHCNTETINLFAEIKFLKEPNRDTYVLGLPARNILYECNTGKNEWITYYQYSVNEILNITCITVKDRTPYWLYEGEIQSIILENLQYGIKNIHYMFLMNNEKHENITCESNKTSTLKQRMIITLLRDTKHEKGVNTNDSYINDSLVHFSMFEIIGLISGFLLAIVTILCILYVWGKKRKTAKKEVFYKFFKNEDNHTNSLTVNIKNENTYVEPKENEYTYIEEDNIMVANDLYNGSSVSNDRQKPIVESSVKEDPYTYITYDEPKHETNVTYAVPYENHNIDKNETPDRGKQYENVQTVNTQEKNNTYNNL